MKTILLITLLLTLFTWCSHNGDAVSELKRLRTEYIDNGRTEESKQKILAFFHKHDSLETDNYEYWVTKAQTFYVFGDYKEGMRIVEKVPDQYLNDPGMIFNRVQRRIRSDKESALYLTRKLCASPQMLMSWIHDIFAHSFSQGSRENPDYADKVAFLGKLADPAYPVLKKNTSGLRYWVKAIQARQDIKALRNIMDKDFWNAYSRAPRYRLLIFAIANRHPQLKTSATKYLRQTIDSLEADIRIIENKNTDERSVLDKRALTRYWLAYAYYLKAQLFSKESVDSIAANLQKASDYSPDHKDRKVEWAYFYDQTILNGKSNYQEDYVNFLIAEGQSETALNAYFPESLYDVDKKERVQKLFKKLFPEEDFNDYWEQQINRYLPEAPFFELPAMDHRKVSLSAYKGKWVLIDFWGTWCAPCRKELPSLDSLNKRLPKNLALLTIACRDTITAVSSFMKEHRYSFPVLLSDKRVVKNYKITGYPSKVLITPSGKYLPVPWQGWKEFVLRYIAKAKRTAI